MRPSSVGRRRREDRGAVDAFEGQIAIASVMLVLEYLTENFKLASDANAGTLIADPPASPDAEVAAVSETRSIKVADTADTTPVAADDGTVAALDAAITPDGGMPDLMISSLPSDFALPESEGHEPPVHNDTISLAYSEFADHRLHGSGKDHTTALNVAAANSAEGRTAAKSPVASEFAHARIGWRLDDREFELERLESHSSNDANGGDAARIHSAIAGHSSTIDTVGTTISDSVSSSLQGATSGHLNDQPHFENATPGTLQSLESPTQAASHAADIPPVTAVEDANGGHAAHSHGAAAEHSSIPPRRRSRIAARRACEASPPGMGTVSRSWGMRTRATMAWDISSVNCRTRLPRTRLRTVQRSRQVEDAKGDHAAHSHGAAAKHSSTVDTPATTIAESDAPGVTRRAPRACER